MPICRVRAAKYELSTRMTSVTIDDSPELTKQIRQIKALEAAGALGALDLSRFQALDRLIARTRGLP